VTQSLPSGVVTFLFTDIAGSTRLLHQLGPEGYAQALAEHRRLLRAAFAQHGGVEVDTQGDAFFVAFSSAEGAVSAARDLERALASGPIEVRVGVHTGTPYLTEEGYVGEDVHKGARIGAAGNGGQVLLSKETSALVDVELTDLGEHRLKDFTEPVWIFQLGTGRFPPLKTISNTNLPRPASSFVGRDQEVAAVTALLRDGARLVTLTGAGGSGKTRLAIESAAELVPWFKNGVFWVGLAALRDPAIVNETISTTLGAKDGLVAHIGDREMLLLLDNMEHVIDAARDLASLVEACPQLVLLVTSRELLRVRGEAAFFVPPMSESEAVDLFCQRAGLHPDELISELCRRLDDLPLAVELAAARTNVLTPRQILQRLAQRLDLLKGGRDAERRHQTLRATIDWSYELLDDEERRLFARLAVFSGGCTLDSAEAVVDADLRILSSLLEKSLIRRTDDRFWMLETIREFATDRFESDGEARDLRSRHADWFSALAAELFDEFGEARDPRAFEVFGDEQDNFRATLGWAIANKTDALQLVMRMWKSWLTRGQLDEGERWLEQALATDTAAPASLRALALAVLGEFPRFRGDHERAIEIKEEALGSMRALGLAEEMKWVLCDMAESLAQLGDLGRARAMVDEALEIESRSKRPSGPRVRASAAELAMRSEDYADAKRRLEDVIGSIQPDRFEMNHVSALAMLADCLGRLGDRAGAGKRFRQAFELAMVSRSVAVLPDLLVGTADLIVAASPSRSATLLGAAEGLRESTGLGVDDPASRAAIERSVEAKLDPSVLESARADGRAMSVDESVAYALDCLDLVSNSSTK
jgi:predicted ATPase